MYIGIELIPIILYTFNSLFYESFLVQNEISSFSFFSMNNNFKNRLGLGIV